MPPSTASIGKIIGEKEQYRIESPVAVGAFSTVYRCTQLSSGRTFAMKIIDKKVAADNHMREALIREVNALEIAGSSPYVTRLVDKMVSKHNYYLVMELAEGGTLLDLIREQRQELRMLQASLSSCRDMAESLRSTTPPFMQYDRVQHFFKQLLLALSTLHDRDVVHRDVKPENILLNRRRTRLVLSDFGFACHAPPGTELHRACGTLRYCAPELLHETPRYDGRKVDVWAAGVTLYVMLFGGHPFRCASQDPDTLLDVILTTRYRIPRPIPADVEDIIQHMLCVNVAERWSVKQLLQHPWMASLGMELRSPSARSASAKRSFVSPAGSSTLPTGSHDAAESVVELLSEDVPPLDAIPSDEELVDDGFYHSSTDDKQSSMSSTSPVQSGVLTRMPTSSTLEPQAADVVTVVATPASVGAAGPNDAAAPAAALPAPTSTPAAAKREVLQQGSVSTSMVSIESCADTDDENGDEEPEEEYGEEGPARGGAKTAATPFPHRRASRPMSDADSSASTNNTFCGDGELETWWVRYTYGLYLTARIVARFAGFVAVCIVAVAVRVVLRRDIVDLPLPEALRSYISYLLFTPLRRSSLVAHQLHMSSSGEPPSPLSATKKERLSAPTFDGSWSRSAREARATANAATHPNRQANTSPIPGSGLRRYVRTADQLMRDSFVGNAVREHNASLTDQQASHSLPSQVPSETSLTSSPAAPSLATIAPCPPSLTETDRLSLTPPTGRHGSEEEEGWIAACAAAACPRDSRCNSTEQHSTTSLNGSAAPTGAEDAAAAVGAAATPLVSLITSLPSPPLEKNCSAVPQPTRRSSGVGGATSKNADSQTGATDTTESGDSGEEKMADAGGHLQNMLSPSAPLPRVFPGHRQRSEDFPILDDNLVAL